MTDGEIARKVEAIFDMRPYFIEQRLKLRTRSIQKLQLTDTWDVRTKSLLKNSLVLTAKI